MKTTNGSRLAGHSAVELAGLVGRGDVSPVDVVTAHLQRVEELDPKLNAFQQVMPAEAMEEARRLQQRPDLADLPLAGVPVAIKDNVDVAGVSTRQGSAATSDRAASQDDELVRRLRAAGAVVIGKTRMPELAVWPLTEPEAFGPTRNPWNPERTSGGSSGGSAVAVATGMAPIALGSDGGGSLRVPAACCGILGFKPTPGLVPIAGGAGEHWLGLTSFGPLANTSADLALALEVLAARSIEDRAPGALRVAVSNRHPNAGGKIAPEIQAAVQATGNLLRGLGHDVREADPHYPSDLGLRFMRRWLPGIATDAAGLSGADLERRTRSMARWGRSLRRLGLARPAAADGFRTRAGTWFEDFDVLVMPTLAESPVPIGRWQGKGWFATTMGVANWILTSPWNLAGFPAASVPAGIGPDGLPMAVQVVAKPGQDSQLLSVIDAIERARPWPRWQSAGSSVTD